MTYPTRESNPTRVLPSCLFCAVLCPVQFLRAQAQSLTPPDAFGAAWVVRARASLPKREQGREERSLAALSVRLCDPPGNQQFTHNAATGELAMPIVPGMCLGAAQ